MTKDKIEECENATDSLDCDYSGLTHGVDRINVLVVNSTKATVERLMNYAVKTPAIDVPTELLQRAITVLRKDSANFEDGDEVTLWACYNDFARLVQPASDLSLLIAERLNDELGLEALNARSLFNSLKFWQQPDKTPSNAVVKCRHELHTVFWWLLSSVVLYLFIQGYTALLSNALDDSNKYLELWKSEQQLVSNLRLTQTEITGEIKNKSILLTTQLAASTQFLVDLTQPLFSNSFVKINPLHNSAQQDCSNLMDQSQDADYLQKMTTCIAFEKHYATSVYTILSQYLLPLVLGILGATAYVVRNTLEKLQSNSYLPGAKGKLPMRLCLGGLLGVMSGIFLSSDNARLEEFNLTLVMVSLVMGYSVEVAFSLFDRAIERMRDWTDSLKNPAHQDKVN